MPWFANPPWASVSTWVGRTEDAFERLGEKWLPHSRFRKRAVRQEAGSSALFGSPVRFFAEGWGVEAAKFEPAAIAATYRQFHELMGWRIPSLTHAVIVLSRAGERHLTEEDRERLWRAFSVPIFEQMIGPCGELMAAECEAHDGLHVMSPAVPLGNGRLCQDRCPCGRTTPRIGVVEGVEAEKRFAAYAR